MSRSEQEILNASYIEATSAIRTNINDVSNSDAGDFRVSTLNQDANFGHTSAYQGDAAFLRTSAIQGDAGLLHVSAIGSLTVSAHEVKQSDAAALRASCFSGDAAFFRVSALGINITDVTNPDAADFRTSSFAVDAGQFRTSAIIDNGSVSAKSGDAGLLRTSAMLYDNEYLYSPNVIVSARGVTPTSSMKGLLVTVVGADAQYNRVSAIGTLVVSAHEVKQSDAASLRTSAIIDYGSVSAMQGAAGNLRMSAFSDDANLFHVSAIGTLAVSAHEVKQSDAASLRISAIQGDAGLNRVSSIGAVISFNGDAANNRVSAIQTDAAFLRTSAFLYDNEYSASPNVIVSARGVTPTSAMKGLLVTVVGADAQYNRVSAIGTLTVSAHEVKQSDAASLRCSAIIDNGSISAMQGAANNLRVSAFSDSAALFRVSTIGTLTVSAHEVKQSDAASLLVSCRADDAALMRVSAVGTLTVSAHEVRQSDAASLHVSAIGTLTVSAHEVKQSDAASLRVSSIDAGASWTVTKQIGRCSATGGVAVWTPAAGKYIAVTDAIFSSLSANAFYLIGAGNAVRSGVVFMAANGGWAPQFRSPFILSANEVLGISADSAVSIGYTIMGYEV